jgi:hypothetical protein
VCTVYINSYRRRIVKKTEMIVKKTEMIVKKKSRVSSFQFLRNIFFHRGVYLVTGGVLKMTELFVRIKGCGVRGSHLRKVGGRGGVGSLN